MNKKELTEADIRTKFITPALVGNAGAGRDVMTQLREECFFTNGRVLVRGKTVKRANGRRPTMSSSTGPTCPSRSSKPRPTLFPSPKVYSRRSNMLRFSTCPSPKVAMATLSSNTTRWPRAARSNGKFSELGDTKTRAFVFELAMLGRSGLDINDPANKYSLRSLPGAF